MKGWSFIKRNAFTIMLIILVVVGLIVFYNELKNDEEQPEISGVSLFTPISEKRQ
ncbi:hypothetical protein [Pontibacillus sp. HMF3514]|uniref:hypothetical protein n=1 Tax=Pontibacillus sp. HMF3514 TaxID=2692425 RepID=UPI00131F51F5|nr:hypothetical protein [Pontibacillus sp. HMF3514]QHE51238.1 hypothetical protein GS400_03970 [Pontibacillus sp. HMF3514]